MTRHLTPAEQATYMHEIRAEAARLAAQDPLIERIAYRIAAAVTAAALALLLFSAATGPDSYPRPAGYPASSQAPADAR